MFVLFERFPKLYDMLTTYVVSSGCVLEEGETKERRGVQGYQPTVCSMLYLMASFAGILKAARP